MNQSELEAHTCNRRQARKNASEKITIGFGFTADWLRKWNEFFVNQSPTAVKLNQNTLDGKARIIPVA